MSSLPDAQLTWRHIQQGKLNVHTHRLLHGFTPERAFEHTHLITLLPLPRLASEPLSQQAADKSRLLAGIPLLLTGDLFSFSSSSLQAPLDQSSEMTLVDSGFAAGKKNFLHLIDKDGEQPQIASVSGGYSQMPMHTYTHMKAI